MSYYSHLVLLTGKGENTGGYLSGQVVFGYSMFPVQVWEMTMDFSKIVDSNKIFRFQFRNPQIQIWGDFKVKICRFH